MPFLITFFDDVHGGSFHAETLSLDELAETIRNTTAPDKASLPLLKTARFGSSRSVKGSLRHDANVLAVTGAPGDYDGMQMPFDEAVARLSGAGVSFVAYTTPSHTEHQPRWRVIAPFSQELPPAHLARMVNRLNGVLGVHIGARKLAAQPGLLLRQYRRQAGTNCRARHRGISRRNG